jgi:hypothetical protein
MAVALVVSSAARGRQCLCRRVGRVVEDGKLVGELSFNGERYEWLVEKAAEHHRADELDRFAKLLDEAEVTIANGRSDLTAVLDFIDGLRRLVPCVHPAAQVAIDETFDKMLAAFDDLAAVRKGAEYIRYRVMQELPCKLASFGHFLDAAQIMAYLFRHRKLLPRRNVEKIPSTFIRPTWECARSLSKGLRFHWPRPVRGRAGGREYCGPLPIGAFDRGSNKLDALLAQTSTSKQDATLFAEMLSLSNDGRHSSVSP